jgi:hypothetical protein
MACGIGKLPTQTPTGATGKQSVNTTRNYGKTPWQFLKASTLCSNLGVPPPYSDQSALASTLVIVGLRSRIRSIARNIVPIRVVTHFENPFPGEFFFPESARVSIGPAKK